MRAARFHAAHDVRVEEVDEPSADLAPHDVLLAPRWCGICGTDMHEYLAGPIVTSPEPHALSGATLPQILGHEFSAEVVAIGAGVDRVVPGDRVSVMPIASCGRCPACLRGRNQLCRTMACVGLSWPWGGMAALAIVPERQVWRLPDAVTDEQAAVIEPGAAAAYGVARAGVSPGDRVLVAGAGPIGALTVLAAHAAGAGEVYVAETNPRRRDRMEMLGAAAVLDPVAVDVAGWVRDRTDGEGVDVAIECAGVEPALRDCLGAVRDRGTVAQVGLHVRPAAIDPMAVSERELTITGVWGYDVHAWPRYIDQVASGRFPVERVITGRIGLDEVVAGGFEALADPAGDDLKVLVSTR